MISMRVLYEMVLTAVRTKAGKATEREIVRAININK